MSDDFPKILLLVTALPHGLAAGMAWRRGYRLYASSIVVGIGAVSLLPISSGDLTYIRYTAGALWILSDMYNIPQSIPFIISILFMYQWFSVTDLYYIWNLISAFKSIVIASALEHSIE
jgi:hypothetical protein